VSLPLLQNSKTAKNIPSGLSSQANSVKKKGLLVSFDGNFVDLIVTAFEG
jgi:hypothetical protein